MKDSQLGKIASICGKVLLWILIILCALFIVLTLSQKQSNDGLAKLFGYSPLAVQSNSMKGDGEDNFQQGDLLFVKVLSEADKKNLKKGDIITFRDKMIMETQTVLNTHRIEEVLDADGKLKFRTKGDNNNEIDANDRYAGDVVALYKGTKIAGAGRVLDFLNSKWGFLFCLVLPLALFFLWRVIKLIMAIRAYKTVQDGDEDDDSGEREIKIPGIGVDANTSTSESDPQAERIAKMLADANISPEVIAAALARANEAEKKDTGANSDTEGPKQGGF